MENGNFRPQIESMYVPPKKSGGFPANIFGTRGIFDFWGRFVGLDPIFVAKGQQLEILKQKMGRVMLESCSTKNMIKCIQIVWVHTYLYVSY